MRFLFHLCAALSLSAAAPATVRAEPNWTKAADERGPMSAGDAKVFMKQLTAHAVEHHMKKSDAPQRGMMYEYLWWRKRGQPGQFIQGEALDTMHDGAWFACAMAQAFRATADPFFKEVLVKWQLPFYLGMLNDGERLFNSERTDVRPEAAGTWTGNKEWLLQGRENGFVPYWWDDGESVSLEMLGKKSEKPFFSCTNEMAGRANPDYNLRGYSHGSSNHLAQDLGVMLVQAWLVLKDSGDAHERDLLRQIALAANHLQECRARHGSPNIPAVLAAVALCTGDAAALARLPSWEKSDPRAFTNHYSKAVSGVPPDTKAATPGFADDDEYVYHAGVVKHGGMTNPLATRLACDAFTHPLLYAAYSDDAPVPPGINRFDLHPFNFINGKPEWLRSQRKGPRGGVLPMGSRFGPQNMVVCGWALQAMKHLPEGGRIAPAVRDHISRDADRELHPDVKAWLERELGAGLRTWEAVFHEYGYIPTGIGCGSAMPGTAWDEFSDTGGYAHLISAAAQWIIYLDGKTDWDGWKIAK